MTKFLSFLYSNIEYIGISPWFHSDEVFKYVFMKNIHLWVTPSKTGIIREETDFSTEIQPSNGIDSIRNRMRTNTEPFGTLQILADPGTKRSEWLSLRLWRCCVCSNEKLAQWIHIIRKALGGCSDFTLVFVWPSK